MRLNRARAVPEWPAPTDRLPREQAAAEAVASRGFGGYIHRSVLATPGRLCKRQPLSVALYTHTHYVRAMADSLGFLVNDVARLIRRRFDERARGVGATRAQWKTLLVLSRNEGLNQGALADRLEVEPITLCRMIDRLEDAGLVERRRDPADRRAWRLFLTDAARPKIAQLQTLADGMFEDIFAGVTPAARERLADTLKTIRDNLLAEPKEAANG